jgi:hypothetical protein
VLTERTQGRPADRRRNILWWGYFGSVVLLFGLTLVSFAMIGFFGSLGAALLNWVNFGFDAICIVGLFSYIRSRPLYVAGFWRVILILLLAKALISASFLAPNLFPWESDQENYVSLAGLLSLAWYFPMTVALWQYAFKSPHIWNNAARYRAVA